MRKMKYKLIVASVLLGVAVFMGCAPGGEGQNEKSGNAETVWAAEEGTMVIKVPVADVPVVEMPVIEVPAAEMELTKIPVVNESTTEEEVQEPVEVVISLAGDCSFGKLSVHSYERTFDEYFDKYGAEYFFQNVKELFEADDLTLVNFEGVLTDSKDIQEKQYNIKGRTEFKEVLTAGSVEAVSFGNNHRFDYGQQGVDDTIAAFNDVNVVYAYDENLGIYETDSGIRIGFVSVNEVYDEKQVEVYLKNGIAILKESTDLILACCHWGEETHHYPEAYQVELGKKCIDWGADLVVGCHPHVLQGIDYYNGKYIIYSLGNFSFGGHKNPKNKNAMIVQATANFDAEGLAGELQLKVIPCRISTKDNSNDYCPIIPEGERWNEIIGLVNKYSAKFPVSVTEDGTVVHE